MGIENQEELKKIMKNLEERDHQDEQRESSPLAMAEDAELIDTTKMSIEDVLVEILRKIRASCIIR